MSGSHSPPDAGSPPSRSRVALAGLRPGDHRRGPDTARLQLRAFLPEDAAVFHRLSALPALLRYIPEPPLESVEAARAAIASYPDWQDPGFGRWAMVHLDDARVIGFAGLKFLPELDLVDLGYRLLPGYWGRGLATEAGRACLDYAFGRLGLGAIHGLVDPRNHASVRVLQKLGMVREGALPQRGSDMDIFVIRRAPRGS